jgi:hypothetical protein
MEETGYSQERAERVSAKEQICFSAGARRRKK